MSIIMSLFYQKYSKLPITHVLSAGTDPGVDVE